MLTQFQLIYDFRNLLPGQSHNRRSPKSVAWTIPINRQSPKHNFETGIRRVCTAHSSQPVARLRATIMSSSDGSADCDDEPLAESGAGKREVQVRRPDDAVKVLSQPLGGRVSASKEAASFVTCRQSSCILYKNYGWLRHVAKERAQCPTYASPVPCGNSSTSNLWRHWKKYDRKAHDAAKPATAARPRQHTLSSCVAWWSAFMPFFSR